MRMGPGNDGPEPPADILRAIRHSIAADACGRAARLDSKQSAYWTELAEDQRSKSLRRLHQAACCEGVACAEARTSSVTPNPASFE